MISRRKGLSIENLQPLCASVLSKKPLDFKCSKPDIRGVTVSDSLCAQPRKKKNHVHSTYAWMTLYEAAILETNPNLLPGRIEDAKDAIRQRIIKNLIDEAERREVVKALNVLAVLKRGRSASRNPLCCQCKDTHDLVTPMNGKSFLAKTASGQIPISLHIRCVVNWADANSFQALVPLRRAHSAGR